MDTGRAQATDGADAYFWLRLPTTAAGREWDTYRCFECGAAGVEECGGEGPEDPPSDLMAYFTSAGDRDRARDLFRDRDGLEAGSAPDQDWDRSWRERQTPVQVGGRLWVVPPWLEPPAGAERALRLEAKRAFGTGEHQSTRIAVRLLEDLDARGKRVLDIGTGTGILALYALDLGAASVTALDIDPVVAACLRENAALNFPSDGARGRLHAFIGGPGALRPDARFDLILCNMIRSEIWPFRAELWGRLAPGGAFAVSGQLREDRPHFLALAGAGHFRVAGEIDQDEWWGFAGRLP